ncbi:MAG: aldo/keto reductase [Chloroflexi bacterium]|nr:aldo/keto reductase [Chloroflexota bacterium]
MDYTTLGRTGVTVSRLGFGGAPIGGLYGRAIAEAQAVATVHRALDLGITFLDTAPLYGEGQSERYVGRALASYAGPRPVVGTKVGRIPRHFDYSYDMTLASVDASLERLGLDYLPLVYLHAVHLAPSMAQVLSPQGALGALRRLQSEGVIGWVGVGTPDPIIADYIASGEVDVALVANCYDLIDRSAAERILPLAAERSVGVVIGGPYGTGILATGAGPGAKYRYRDAPPEIFARVRRYERVCREFGVSLKAVALRFCLRHPAVHAVIPGMASPQEVEETVAAFSEHVPAEIWEAL